jgi:hypothetical protein
MRLLSHVLVVLEDSASTRLAMRYCDETDHGNFTTFDCPDEASYLLTRHCTDEYYYAPGICCKTDSALQFAAFYDEEFFRDIEYVVLSDDDEFWRVDQFLKWLYLVDYANVSNVPLIGNNHPYSASEKGGVWGQRAKGRCAEIQSIGW